MALFNYATRELSAKIVYYGPGLSGKTTNIEKVHELLRPEQKGRLISLPTETDRTLFFDFLPLDLGEIKGFKVRFHLYTVPGQVFYNATRRLVLQGVDGVVFVADSQVDMMESNLESLKNLHENLATYGKKLEELPFVIQYNKRDLKNIETVENLDRRLNPMHVPSFEGCALTGEGVTETLVAISRRVFNHLRKTLLMPGETEESDEFEDLAGTTIGEKFAPEEEAPALETFDELEELSDFEEIRETSASGGAAAEEPGAEGFAGTPAAGIDTGPSVGDEFVPGESSTGMAPEADTEEGFEEIEIDLPDRPAEPVADGEPEAGIAVETGPGLTFLKFDSPFVTPEGHAVLPAVFLDPEGRAVRLRIRVAVEEDRE
ncbi:MAG: hypothetical protein Kow00128_03700 [Deltaproteobacteria bacterium]